MKRTECYQPDASNHQLIALNLDALEHTFCNCSFEQVVHVIISSDCYCYS